MACAAALCAQATGVRSSVASKRFLDHALKIMDRLKTLGYSKMDQLLQDPDFAILHGDPRFIARLQNWKTLDEYWVANCEVTRGQFEKFVKDDKVAVSEKPEKWEGNFEGISPTDEHPAQQVSWYDAVMYCNWLSLNEGRSPSYRRSGTKEKVGYGNDGKMSDAWEEIPGTTGYRLLREAEWEEACRAGTETEYSSGNDEIVLVKYSQMYPFQLTSLSGSRLPNGWGLHDMHGNVSEWCFDKSSEGRYRVLRGGSWYVRAANCRSASRFLGAPADRDLLLGFRLALSPSRESGVQVAEPAGVGTEGAPAEQRP